MVLFLLLNSIVGNSKNRHILAITCLILSLLFIRDLNAQVNCSSISTEQGGKYYIDDCCTIDSPVDYVLSSDLYSASTCFIIGSSDFTIDLNGKTIEYAQEGSGIAFKDNCANCTGMTITNTNTEIEKGKITGGKYPDSHAFSFVGASNIEISNLTITAAGEDTQGIIVDYGEDLSIHDVEIYIDAQKSNPCSHYTGHIAGISLNGRSGETSIYNNRIIGKTMRGIKITGCGTWEKDMLIHDNYISLESMINDGYAISMEGNDGICSSGTKIYNNIINQINGRGIIVAGWDHPTDIGPGNFDIYNNSIFVQEGSDCEDGGTPGRAVGIRLRFGSHDYTITNNYIKGYAGRGVGVNHTANFDGGGVVGMALTTTGGNDPDYRNLIVGNYVDVETNVTDNSDFYYAEGILVTNYDNKNTPKYLINNTIKSNDYGYYTYRASYGDLLQDIYSYIQGGKFIQAFNPDEGIYPTDRYRDVYLGWWNRGASNTHFLNVTGDSGSGFHLSANPDPTLRDFHMYNDTTTFDNIDISWTLKVRAEDASGNSLEGVSIRIEGPYDAFTGTTDSDGLFEQEVISSSYSGATVVDTSHNDYSVQASYNDGISLRNENIDSLSITEPTFLTITFSEITNPSGDITPPIINNGDPTGTLPPEMTSTQISLNTNEASTCRYAEELLEYANMTGVFTSSNEGKRHQATVSGITGGESKNYYVRCRDQSPNLNTNMGSDYYTIAFWRAYGRDSNIVEDKLAPATISDLQAICDLTSCTLYWTAPGDDGYAGIASEYDIRYGLSSDAKSNWDSYVQVTQEPSPKPSGTKESMLISGLDSHETYWFSIQTADEEGNYSSISDPVSGITEEPPPEPQIPDHEDPKDPENPEYLDGSGWTVSGGCGILVKTHDSAPSTNATALIVLLLSICALKLSTPHNRSPI